MTNEENKEIAQLDEILYRDAVEQMKQQQHVEYQNLPGDGENRGVGLAIVLVTAILTFAAIVLLTI